MSSLSLLPSPRSLTFAAGQYTVAPGRRIVLQGVEAPALLFSGQRLREALRRYAAVEWELSASTAGPPDQIGALLRVAPERIEHPQGYELSVTPERIVAEAHAPAGIFYAVCTLIQMLEQAGGQLPCLHISDWPDFPARGVMLDVSRDKVPTMETLLALVDMLAGWKINQLQLYTEHTFAYRNHPEVWAAASPFTGQEMLELDRYCRERQIELVPNQNSFGHMHRWLIHDRYAGLAEVNDGFTIGSEYHAGPFSLAPVDPRSLDLIRSLYDELLPHFSSRMFNVGCDETFDLGQGRSKEACERYGVGRVYLDFLRKIYDEVRARGRLMQFWGDIIIQHPDLIPELPKEAIALEWGYEADHPFELRCPQYAAAGMPFYVCPGTSSWCSLAGRTDNALGNLLNAAEHGLKHGAIGYLITDWGDRGHWQVLPISYLGLAAGAAYAWALDANRTLDVPSALNLHAFRDRAGVMGRLADELGNVCRGAGLEVPNGTVLFWTLQSSLEQVAQRYGRLGAGQFERSLAAIDQVLLPLAEARMERPDAALIAREYTLTARLLRHACRRAILALDPSNAAAAPLGQLDEDMRQITEEYQQVWLARNRKGGLADSVQRLEKGLGVRVS